MTKGTIGILWVLQGAGKLPMCCILRELSCFLSKFLWRGAAVPGRSDAADVYLNTMPLFCHPRPWPFPYNHQKTYPDHARIFKIFNILSRDRFHATWFLRATAPESTQVYPYFSSSPLASVLSAVSGMSPVREGHELSTHGPDRIMVDSRSRQGKPKSKGRTRSGCITCRCVPA